MALSHSSGNGKVIRAAPEGKNNAFTRTLSSYFFPANASLGFTLTELLVFITISVILSLSIIVIINPIALRKRARDTKRISDMQILSAVLEHYIADNGVPPDANQILRTSSQSATPSSQLVHINGTGWIPIDLTGYAEKLPIDPLNTGDMIYRYYRLGNLYKIDAKLEYFTSKMSSDGGTDGCRYELGSGVDTITLSSISTC